MTLPPRLGTINKLAAAYGRELGLRPGPDPDDEAMDQLVDLTDHLVEDVDDCLDQMKGINRYAGGQVAFQPDRPCIILRRAACEGSDHIWLGGGARRGAAPVDRVSENSRILELPRSIARASVPPIEAGVRRGLPTHRSGE